MATPDHIAVVGEKFGSFGKGIFTDKAGNESIQKVFPVGPDSRQAIASYGLASLHRKDRPPILVAKLIDEFLPPREGFRDSYVKRLCPEFAGYRWTDDSAETNARRLAEGIQACWTPPLDGVSGSVYLAVFYFDKEAGNQPTMLRLTVSPHAIGMPTVTVLSDDDCAKRNTIGMLGDSTLTYRMISGVDHALMSELSARELGAVKGAGERCANSFAQDLNDVRNRLYPGNTRPTGRHPFRFLGWHVLDVPLSGQCAREIAKRLVETQLEFAKLPSRSSLEVAAHEYAGASYLPVKAGAPLDVAMVHRVGHIGDETQLGDDACRAAMIRPVERSPLEDDGVWVDRTRYPVAHALDKERLRESSDLEAWFRVSRNEDYLFILVEVVDDIVTDNEQVSVFVEVPKARVVQGMSDYAHFVFTPKTIPWERLNRANNDKVKWDNLRAPRKIPERDGDERVVGYAVKIAIPWDVLSSYIPQQDDAIGFDIQIQDYDSSAELPALVGWSPAAKATGKKHSPPDFGSAILSR